MFSLMRLWHIQYKFLLNYVAFTQHEHIVIKLNFIQLINLI